MKPRNPKDLLSERELLGFVRRAGDQVAHRAGSAKVTTTKSLAELDEEATAGSSRRHRSRSS